MKLKLISLNKKNKKDIQNFCASLNFFFNYKLPSTILAMIMIAGNLTTAISWLVLISLQQHSRLLTDMPGTCTHPTVDIRTSIRKIWDITKNLESVVFKADDAKIKLCFRSNLDASNHHLGIEIMKTSKVIFCFALKQEEELPINLINEMVLSLSVLMDSLDICVKQGDFKEISCQDLQYDHSYLYKTIVEQARLLELLLMNLT